MRRTLLKFPFNRILPSGLSGKNVLDPFLDDFSFDSVSFLSGGSRFETSPARRSTVSAARFFRRYQRYSSA